MPQQRLSKLIVKNEPVCLFGFGVIAHAEYSERMKFLSNNVFLNAEELAGQEFPFVLVRNFAFVDGFWAKFMRELNVIL